MRAAQWDVYTGDPNSERGDEIFIGSFFGFVDDIALRLAKQQQGFWCDGKLKFKKAVKLPKLPAKRQVSVNVMVEGEDWVSPSKLNKAVRYFKNRPVRVAECNQYGAVTLKKI